MCKDLGKYVSVPEPRHKLCVYSSISHYHSAVLTLLQSSVPQIGPLFADGSRDQGNVVINAADACKTTLLTNAGKNRLMRVLCYH